MDAKTRRSVIGATIAAAMAITFLITQPIAQRYSETRLKELPAAMKPSAAGGYAGQVIKRAFYPAMGAVFVSMIVGLGIGLVVARKLPPPDAPVRRRRR